MWFAVKFTKWTRIQMKTTIRPVFQAKYWFKSNLKTKHRIDFEYYNRKIMQNFIWISNPIGFIPPLLFIEKKFHLFCHSLSKCWDSCIAFAVEKNLFTHSYKNVGTDSYFGNSYNICVLPNTFWMSILISL